MAGPVIHKVLPTATRGVALQESREVEGVSEVDAAVFRHRLHLVFVDFAQAVSLDECVDKQRSQTDDLDGVAADLEQAWDVDPKLLLLQPRVLRVFVCLLHFQLFFEVFVFV